MSKQALLIIDVQNCMYMEGYEVHEGQALLSKLNMLIDRARATQVPVIYIQHCGNAGDPHEHGTHGWEIHPAIAPQPDDLVIQKTAPDSFFQTLLKDELSARGIKKLILTGIQTDFCVDTTCRRAFSEGYEVLLVEDAHSTWGHEDGLTAEQIITHHNVTLGNWFATLARAEDIHF